MYKRVSKNVYDYGDEAETWLQHPSVRTLIEQQLRLGSVYGSDPQRDYSPTRYATIAYIR